MQEEIFVPLKLAGLKESILNDSEITPHFALNDALRPSIETAMHAVLRHRVVIHVHSINAIAWAIRLDGPEQLKERLTGLHWQWISVRSVRIPLAREIESGRRCAETDVSHPWNTDWSSADSIAMPPKHFCVK